MGGAALQGEAYHMMVQRHTVAMLNEEAAVQD